MQLYHTKYENELLLQNVYAINCIKRILWLKLLLIRLKFDPFFGTIQWQVRIGSHNSDILPMAIDPQGSSTKANRIFFILHY